MVGRMLTSVIWGIVADRYGRKPVILIEIASVLVIFHFFLFFISHICFISYLNNAACHRVIFNTLFGVSVNFWMAIITRFCLGSFNGLLVPIKVFLLSFAQHFTHTHSINFSKLIKPKNVDEFQAYAMETIRDEYHGLALSTVST